MTNRYDCTIGRSFTAARFFQAAPFTTPPRFGKPHCAPERERLLSPARPGISREEDEGGEGGEGEISVFASFAPFAAFARIPSADFAGQGRGLVRSVAPLLMHTPASQLFPGLSQPFGVGRSLPGARPEVLAVRPDLPAVRLGVPAVRPGFLAARPGGLAVRPEGLDARPEGLAMRPDGLDARPEGLDGGQNARNSPFFASNPLFFSPHAPKSPFPEVFPENSPALEGWVKSVVRPPVPEGRKKPGRGGEFLPSLRDSVPWTPPNPALKGWALSGEATRDSTA